MAEFLNTSVGESTQKGVTPFPPISHSGCRKGETQCVSVGWHLGGGDSACKNSHQIPVVKLSKGQPANGK